MNDEFDRKLDAALQALPEAVAPPDLIKRTMARLSSAAPRVHPSRAFATWPLPARIAFVTASLAILAAAWWAQPLLAALLRLGWAHLQGEFAWVAEACVALRDAVGLGVAHLNQQILIGAAVFATLSYVTCIGFGTLIYRYVSVNTTSKKV